MAQAISTNKHLTAADVLNMFADTDRRFKETARQFEETDKRFKETDKQLKRTDKKINALTSRWSFPFPSFSSSLKSATVIIPFRSFALASSPIILLILSPISD